MQFKRPIDREFASVISSNNLIEREVIYLGIATAIVGDYINRTSRELTYRNLEVGFKIHYTKILDAILRIAIIDSALLESCFRKLFQIKTLGFQNESGSSVATADCFLTALGVNDVFTEGSVRAVNENLSTYKTAHYATIKWLNAYKEEAGE